MTPVVTPQLGYYTEGSFGIGSFHLLPHWVSNPSDLSRCFDLIRNKSFGNIPETAFLLRDIDHLGGEVITQLVGSSISNTIRLSLQDSLIKATVGFDYDP
jgi:hypothetical protein